MSGPTAAPRPAPTRARYVVLGLLALAPFCAYLTRNLSAANTTIIGELKVSDAEMGEILAGFALGYFFFQVPGGLLAGALGTRAVLPAIGLAWSACAVWGSLASTGDELHLSRVALGFAQAGLVPCCAKVVADWFPVARRGIASAVMTGAMQMGAVTATGLTAALLPVAGWRHVLQSYAGAGIAWAVVFGTWFRNRPQEHSWANGAERDLIAAGRAPAAPAAGRRGFDLRLLLSVSLWAYFAQALLRAYAAEFFYTWCPAYFEGGHGRGREEAGLLATYPVMALGAGGLLAGLLIDGLLRATGSRWLSRSGASAAGMFGCAACFALAAQTNRPSLVVVLLSVGALLMSIGGPGTWAAGMDLGGRHTPVVVGAMNMMGTVGGYLCPRHVGALFSYVKASGASWGLVLWLLAGVSAAAAAAWLFVNPRGPPSE